MAKKESGRYTIFDATAWYWDSPQKTGSLSKYDLQMYAVNQSLKRSSLTLQKGDFIITDSKNNRVKIVDETGDVLTSARVNPKTQTVTIKKPGGKKVTINTSGKKVSNNALTHIAKIFSGKKGSGKKTVLDKQLSVLAKSGVAGTIKFTPEGNTPYITHAGTFQGQPGQWVTWATSKGNSTITAFNPASGAPPANFYT